MLIWIMTVLVGAAAVCVFVDAVKSWTARGLFLVALALWVDLLNQAVH